ncbi:PIG-L family deacetylase [Desulfonema ishimotonii]|uniref:PIG-L family deacetylase n=1 Tax=Desulfonema ishimotonii TaxID=45657 RepID=A0A401FZ20_9BACT|nr:PIG-L family deacetylase [Desulfonema ishimotonii]GBC62218.1 PIG-L family deacetylase [Desulfonema ishimotonii]
MQSRYLKIFKGMAKSARSALRRSWLERRLPVREISGRSALIVAPHPDDETFGAGGLIALKRTAGVSVRVLFLTGGEASHTACCNTDRELIRSVRRQQASAASVPLGLSPDDLIWSDFQDGNIPHEGSAGFEHAVAGMSEVILRFQPDEIYCPHPADGHPDHRAATRITETAVKHSVPYIRIVYYTVWACYNAPHLISGGWRLDARPVYEKKAAAIREYLDQKPAPCGIPWCGRLPEAVIRSARSAVELYRDKALSRNNFP